jgi:hypothetical protein
VFVKIILRVMATVRFGGLSGPERARNKAHSVSATCAHARLHRIVIDKYPT